MTKFIVAGSNECIGSGGVSCELIYRTDSISSCYQYIGSNECIGSGGVSCELIYRTDSISSKSLLTRNVYY